MTQTGSSRSIQRQKNMKLSFLAEAVFVDSIRESELGKLRTNNLEQRRNELQEEAKEGLIEGILALEKSHLTEELATFTDSKSQKSSLEKGLEQIIHTISILDDVRDVDYYQRLAKRHKQKKNMINGLPDDIVREIFRSHKTRLSNTDSSRMDIDERKVLDQRRENIIIAENLYISLQEMVSA